MPGNGLAFPLGIPLGEWAEPTPFEPVVDHDAVYRAKLLEQFRSKPRMNALVNALLSGSQDIADTVHTVQTTRTINGTDDQIDTLAALQDFEREGRSDAAVIILYFAWVRARQSNGTLDDLYNVLEYLAPGGAFAVDDLHSDPASFLVRITVPPLVSPPVTADDMTPETAGRILREARGKGIGMWFESVPVDSSRWFLTIDGYTLMGPDAHGLSDDYTSPTTGGYLSRMEMV